MVYFLVLVVFVKVLVVFSEIGVVLVVFGSGGSETLTPTLKMMVENLEVNFFKIIFVNVIRHLAYFQSATV